MANKTAKKATATRENRSLQYIPRAISRTRQDIKDYVFAVNMWKNVQMPRTYKLQNIFEIVSEDDMVLSQSRNRKLAIFSRSFVLKNISNKEENDDLKTKLIDSGLYRQFATGIQEAEYYDYTLAEMDIKLNKRGEIKYNLVTLDRKNVVPQTGEYFPDYSIPQSIKYRELPEFETYIFEFRGTTPLGLLNACAPKALMKRFSTSCWAEFTEIYGTPPRVMKTNTQDKSALDRAEDMMRTMGSSAYFIIDDEETFEFAQAVASNGDVYDKLIAKLDNAMQNIITGVIIGQDTKNGSNSKEQTSKLIADSLIQADLEQIQMYFNQTICPALYEIGFFDQEVRFEFQKTIDLAQLWAIVKDLLPYKDFTNEYLKDTFGVEAQDKKQPDNTANTKLASGADFFV